jgi:DNA-binding GntR family transcriptional regulator
MQRIANEARVLVRIFALRSRGHGAAMLDKIYAQHNEIVQALRERQPERALRILSDHIQISLEESLEELDSWNRERSMRREPPLACALSSGRLR